MSAEEGARQAFKEGERLFEAGDYAGSLATFDQALKHRPDLAVAWVNRGIALGELGRHQEAVESYDQALKHRPDLAEAWSNRGSALGLLGRHQEAMGSCDEALKHRPDLAEAWVIRGAVLGLLGRHQEAVGSCDEALKHRPDDAEAWLLRGIALGHLGRHQEAVGSYDEALKHRPDLAEAWAGRLRVLQELEKWLKERLPPKPHGEAFELVAWIEERLHISIRQRLQQTYGKEEQEWWPQGVPLPIRQKCAQRREEDPRRRPLYNQTDLLDLKDIIDKQWKLFEPDFQKVKGSVNSKKDFLSTLERLNEVRKEVMHPVRGGLTEDDLAFARQMREVIESFASLE